MKASSWKSYRRGQLKLLYGTGPCSSLYPLANGTVTLPVKNKMGSDWKHAQWSSYRFPVYCYRSTKGQLEIALDNKQLADLRTV